MNLLLLLFIFLKYGNCFLTVKFYQTQECDFKYLQFIDPSIKKVEVVIRNVSNNDENLDKQRNLNNIYIGISLDFYTISWLPTSIEDDKLKLIIKLNDDYQKIICIGLIPLQFYLNYNFTLNFYNDKKFSLDEDDSVILPKKLKLKYKEYLPYQDEIFLMLMAIIIGCFIVTIFYLLYRKEIKIDANENDIVFNRELYEYNGNFKKLISNRHKVLNNDKYPSDDEIIDFPKWKSRRLILKGMRENNLRVKRHRHKAENIRIKKVRNVRKSQDDIVKRGNLISDEKAKNKDSNQEIRGPTKFSDYKAILKKNHRHHKKKKQ